MKKLFLILTILPLFFIVTEAKATTIFSPLLEMEIDPGQSQTGILKIYNETDQDLYLKSSIESFAAADETGQAKYIPIEQKNSFLEWFTVFEDEIVLKPHQVVLVPFIVEVVKSATPGGYYAVIFWQTAPSPTKPSSEVGVSSKVGTLIFLKVKGEVREQGEVLEFATKPNKNYFFGLPIDFLIRFENSGNVHLKPVGEIKLTNLFGQSQNFTVNDQQRNVLPQSVRQFEIIWGQSLTGNWLTQFLPAIKEELKYLVFGPYQATLTLDFGLDKKQTIVKQLNFWLIPYRLITTLVVVIFILIILFKINKKIRSFKKSEPVKN